MTNTPIPSITWNLSQNSDIEFQSTKLGPLASLNLIKYIKNKKNNLDLYSAKTEITIHISTILISYLCYAIQ